MNPKTEGKFLNIMIFFSFLIFFFFYDAGYCAILDRPGFTLQASCNNLRVSCGPETICGKCPTLFLVFLMLLGTGPKGPEAKGAKHSTIHSHNQATVEVQRGNRAFDAKRYGEHYQA